MPRILLSLSTAFALVALVALAAPVDGQLNFGVQGAYLTGVDDSGPASLNNTFGLGGRVGFSPPLSPIGVIGQGTYYFPDIDDFSYSTYSLAAQFRLSVPMLTPYAIGGWQWRRTSFAGTSSTESGAMIGVGVQLNFMVALFLEGTLEFNDEVTGMPNFDNKPIVIKGGIIFGG